MNKFSTLIAFIFGAACGSVGTYIFVKKKYERISQEEINSVKEGYKNHIYCHVDTTDIPSENEENDWKKVVKHTEYLEKDGILKTSGDRPWTYDDSLTPTEDSTLNYNRESPYVISPEEFASNDDYEKISYTYYSEDAIVVDEMNAEVTDYEYRIGDDFLTHFGEYEDDCVYIRNDVLKNDYEIILDNGSYYPSIFNKEAEDE